MINGVQEMDEETPETKEFLTEYADVFPEKLLNEMPPECQITHRIEIEPGSTPPAKPAYRMSP